jgi:hypothetical protein
LGFRVSFRRYWVEEQKQLYDNHLEEEDMEHPKTLLPSVPAPAGDTAYSYINHQNHKDRSITSFKIIV